MRIEGRGSCHGQVGAFMVEGAVSALLFLFIIFTGTEIALLGLRNVSLQYTAAAGMRWSVLGQRIEYPENSDVLLTRERSIEMKLAEIAEKFGLDLGAMVSPGDDHPYITICPINSASCSMDDAGASREFFEITVRQPVQALLWDITLEASAVGRAEPFVGG